MKKESPFGKFGTGSKETLFGEGVTIDKLRMEVYDFWEREYSAEKFCIVLGETKASRHLRNMQGHTLDHCRLVAHLVWKKRSWDISTTMRSTQGS